MADRGTLAKALSVQENQVNQQPLSKKNYTRTCSNEVKNGQGRVFTLKCMFHHDTAELVLRREIFHLSVP